MDQFVNFIFSVSFLSLAISVIIFIVILTLVVKRLIGFFVTLLLLVFAIIAGYAVLNHEIVSKALEQYLEGKGNQGGAVDELKKKVTNDIQGIKDQLNTKSNEIINSEKEEIEKREKQEQKVNPQPTNEKLPASESPPQK